MARARNIKPAFFTNDDLVEMPFETRLLFIGLWTVADREGRLVDRPKKIKMEIFPSDDVDCEASLKLLDDAGFIARYEFGKHRVIEIINFCKHQSPHSTEKDSALPNREGMFTVNERNKSGGITGEFRVLTQDQLENNVKKPLANVNPSSHNALIPECGILIPESRIMNPEPIPVAPAPGVAVERRAEVVNAIESQAPLELVAKQSKPRGDAGADVRAVFTYWQAQRGHDRAKLDDKRAKAIRARLTDGYSAEDLCKAVDGIAKSSHHMGQNDTRTVYDDIELICRSATNVDKFIKLATDGNAGGGLQRQGAILKDWI